MIIGNEVSYLTLEGLVEQFNVFEEVRELTQYDITENFPKYGERKYTLYNLKGEIEYIDNCKMVVFSDAEEVLIEDDTRVLNGFLEQSIFEIAYSTDNHIFEAEIVFKDGFINIAAHYA
jgi:hypothetical protein